MVGELAKRGCVAPSPPHTHTHTHALCLHSIAFLLVPRRNPLGCNTRTTEYQLLLFYLELYGSLAEDKSFVAVDPRRRRSLVNAIGTPQTPYRFKTVIVLLASLRVPDAALLPGELDVRRKIKEKAQYLYQRSKVIASLHSYVTLCRVERNPGALRTSAPGEHLAAGGQRGDGMASRRHKLRLLRNVRSGVRICSKKLRHVEDVTRQVSESVCDDSLAGSVSSRHSQSSTSAGLYLSRGVTAKRKLSKGMIAMRALTRMVK